MKRTFSPKNYSHLQSSPCFLFGWQKYLLPYPTRNSLIRCLFSGIWVLDWLFHMSCGLGLVTKRKTRLNFHTVMRISIINSPLSRRYVTCRKKTISPALDFSASDCSSRRTTRQLFQAGPQVPNYTLEQLKSQCNLASLAIVKQFIMHLYEQPIGWITMGWWLKWHVVWAQQRTINITFIYISRLHSESFRSCFPLEY